MPTSKKPINPRKDLRVLLFHPVRGDGAIITRIAYQSAARGIECIERVASHMVIIWGVSFTHVGLWIVQDWATRK
jgi:hypothetical protein